MSLFRIAWRLFIHRRYATHFTVLVTTLAVGLAIAVMGMAQGASRELSTDYLSSVLLVGKRGTPDQLFLSSLHQIGTPPPPMREEEALQISRDPHVAAAIPLALVGHVDGHYLMGTSSLEEWVLGDGRLVMEIKRGRFFYGEGEAVLGSQSALDLGLELGGVIRSRPFEDIPELITNYRQNSFRVVGILEETQTPFDRAVFVSLKSAARLKEPLPEVMSETTAFNAEETPRKTSKGETGTLMAPKEEPIVTAMLITLKNSEGEAVFLHRVKREGALAAVRPDRELRKMAEHFDEWKRILLLVTFLAALFASLVMAGAVYAASERWWRDLAVMRALGAPCFSILWIVLISSSLLGGVGAGLGWLLGRITVHLGVLVLSRVSEILISPYVFSQFEFIYLIIMVALAGAAGLIPAYRIFRMDVVNSLRDT